MGRSLSGYQKGIVKRYYEHKDTIQANKLSEIVSDLWLAEDGPTKSKLWKRAEQILTSAGIKKSEVRPIVGKRDIKALGALVQQVDAGSAPKQPEGAEGTGGEAPEQTGPMWKADGDTRTVQDVIKQKAEQHGFDSLEEENLKRALKAFRKKLKALKLEDESRLGNRYVTYGRESNITGIQPPNQYPPEVWAKLVELGRLKKAGQGTFALP